MPLSELLQMIFNTERTCTNRADITLDDTQPMNSANKQYLQRDESSQRIYYEGDRID
jgi:hypothetical protein